jgi:predicted metal-dependent HD superfamily phosphohydrolase
MNLQPVLDRWNISMREEDILEMWNAPHRKYHSINHLKDLMQQIEKAQVSEYERDMLQIVAIFHDIIYDPQQKNNEELSAKFFLSILPIRNKSKRLHK